MEARGLDQVLEDLRERGIKAGREEGERIVAEAKEKAARILEDAKREAEAIRKKAQADAEKLRHQMESELRAAADAALSAFRQALVKSFALPTISKDVEAVVSKPDFLEKLLAQVIQGFVASGFEKSDLEVLLPEDKKKELEAHLVARLKARAGSGVKISYERIRFGFKIRNNRLELDFSDGAFDELFLHYISNRFKEYFKRPSKADSGS